MSRIPIPKIISNELRTNVNNLVDKQKKNSETLNTIKTKFLNYFVGTLKLSKINTKLFNWYNLNFPDFIKEINKLISILKEEKLSKLDEMEWMKVFETKKAEAQELKAEIDNMVYELYELTEEEIAIVGQS
jgi:hypothetical protein